MTLHDRLRRAFRRVEPSDEFAAGVMARLAGAAQGPPAATRGAPRWAMAASVLVALAAALGGGVAWHRHAQRLETERLLAREAAIGRELAYALDLTSRELESVHRHLQRTSEETGS